MNERNMSIVFSSGINDINEYNSSFDRGILRVCYTGRNRNNSFISKETFERCMSSIYNCPIVCRYDRETDTIGAHDMELVTDSEGNIRIINVTQPVGVVPESARYWWEEIEDSSGIHEYLCVDVLLWKRQEAYRKIKEDGITDESMEISVKEGEMIDGIYVINRFEFTAFCLLGTAEPCFESASLSLFTCDDFKTQLAEMMQEFKESFSMMQPSHEDAIYSQNFSEGGEKTLDAKIALMTEFGFTADQIDFNLEDFSIEELKAKFEQLSTDDTGSEENYALAEQFRSELIDALSTETIETCFGVMTRYWYVDHDNELMEVYCHDAEDWKLYGFPYSLNGDNVVINFTDKKRKKFSIIDFDEGEQQAMFSHVFEFLTEKFNENTTSWEEKYQSSSEALSSMEDELKELRQFKADTEDARIRDMRKKVFDSFSDLVGIDAFDTLKESCENLSVEELEEKCYAIRGRNGTSAKFNLEPKSPKLPIEQADAITEPYGGVFTKYGITKQ